jgi:large subunit ribosomal protein L2
MGKRLLVQRRGRGSSVFRSPSWKREGSARYRPFKFDEVYTKIIAGTVVELLHDPGRGCPLARVKFEDGVEMLMVAPEGLAAGQRIYYGANAPVRVGNILPVGKVPEGTMVCNIEIRPGDGGKLARSSGTYATVLAHRDDKTLIQLPSKKVKEVSSHARVTIGIVAGGGRVEKPMLKAGKMYYLSKARSFKYPTVRGKAMGAYAHPAGGGHHPKGLVPVSRTAPPGQKVGHIAPRRTGRKRGGGQR